MFLAKKLNNGAGSPAALDAQFNYVTMLLHGDGTNGAQNNTFLDSSTNNFTITRNGNTTQGSFSPYGSNWSNFFDGTGDSLSIASASALNIGSADMTMEFWMLIPSAFASDYRVVFAKGNSASGGNSYAIEGMTSGALTLWINTDGGSGWNLFSGNSIGTPTVGAWNHVVVCRSGTTWYSFMNGTRVLNTTGAGTVTASSTAVTIGDYGTAGFEYTGYVSNLRLVNGTAVYANATTCTVPTTPLTAVTNTALLTCQSNRFLDNSTNNFTITTTGSPSVQRFNPFGASTAYSPAVIGGSAYFDGSNDWLKFPSGALGFGTGNFTIEMWVNPSANQASYAQLLNKGATEIFNLGFYPSTTQLNFYDGSSLGFFISASSSIPIGAWTHVALVRNSGTLTLYQNGVSAGSATYTANITDDYGHIGCNVNETTYFFNGYLSNYRITNSAVYTSTFTPPTAPVTAISGTSLLLNYTNGAIFDNAMMNDLETVGNAQISTSVYKYGTGSMAFDGTGDYLTSNAPTNNYAFGTGDFTIEGWFYLNTTASSQNFLDFRSSPSDVAGALYFDTTNVNWYVSGANRITGGTLSTSTWYHIAVCRSGTSTKLFISGTQVGSTYTDTNNYICPSGRPYLGALGDGTGTLYFNGYMDDIRITKGYARYTANFTAPTAAFQNIGPY